MPSLHACFCTALILFSLGACSTDRGRFVKPVATPVAGDGDGRSGSRSEDGYLRIFVSSNLDANGRALDFGTDDERPAMLLISARFGKGTVASFASDADPEIPVLLYDVQAGKTVSSVVDNALLTEGLLVDPESLSRSPHLQIVVRGVPTDKARWVTNLLQLATSEPLLKIGFNFVPGGQAVSALSTRLGELLSEEIKTSNKPWEEKTLLGLRSDQGLAALDGRQFVVLLNSTTATVATPPPELSRCDLSRSPTGLCTPGGAAWVPAAAYVRFELDVSDYRSVKDFIGAAVSCEADERVWGEYRALIGSGQLARWQTQYERHLLARGELLLAIRRAVADSTPAPYVGRLLHFAQQAALLPTPEDGYWIEHFRDRARQIDGCLRDAERELTALNRLLALDDLRALDRQSLDSLLALSAQLRQILLPAYERIGRQLLAAEQAPEAALTRLEALAARSACSECVASLRASAEILRSRLKPVEPAPNQAPDQAPELAPPPVSATAPLPG